MFLFGSNVGCAYYDGPPEYAFSPRRVLRQKWHVLAETVCDVSAETVSETVCDVSSDFILPCVAIYMFHFTMKPQGIVRRLHTRIYVRTVALFMFPSKISFGARDRALLKRLLP